MILDYPTLSIDRGFVILAPDGATIPEPFWHVRDDKYRYLNLMNQMQKLRGGVYLRDGAITGSQLDSVGRHRLPEDRASWHLLRLRHDGTVSGCARILVHPSSVSYPELRVASSALAGCRTWGSNLRAAMEDEISSARKTGNSVVEPGGWALAEDLRGSSEAFSIVVSALAWAQLVGGCIGFMTATVRHGASSILRRLGGAPVSFAGSPAPPYFDPAYGCDMELLRFDSSELNPRFSKTLEKMRHLLAQTPVIATGTSIISSVPIAA